MNVRSHVSVHDYLLKHSHFEWTDLLISWTWQMPTEFTVWLVNRFGDLFLVLPDDSVQMVDVGAGTVTKLAESRVQFCQKLDEGDHASEWLRVPLVDRLVATGVCLRPGFCYSFEVPPVLGGQPTVENTIVRPILDHYRTHGAVHGRFRNMQWGGGHNAATGPFAAQSFVLRASPSGQFYPAVGKAGRIG